MSSSRSPHHQEIHFIYTTIDPYHHCVYINNVIKESLSSSYHQGTHIKESISSKSWPSICPHHQGVDLIYIIKKSTLSMSLHHQQKVHVIKNFMSHNQGIHIISSTSSSSLGFLFQVEKIRSRIWSIGFKIFFSKSYLGFTNHRQSNVSNEYKPLILITPS